MGMILAGGYAVALGVLRIMTKGLLIPIGTHVFADVTIFIIILAWMGKI